jgi:hypothetical protein
MTAKPLFLMTDAELAAERARWSQEIADAPGWGAAVAAAHEFRDDCDRELRRRAAVAREDVAVLDEGAGRRRPRPAERAARTVVVPVDILDRLAPHAVQRRLTVNALVRDLLDEIAERGLVATVLDDGDPAHG